LQAIEKNQSLKLKMLLTKAMTLVSDHLKTVGLKPSEIDEILSENRDLIDEILSKCSH
jgi:hypothetical protein